MVSSPKPTLQQLRQHALDRAIQPDLVQKLVKHTRPSEETDRTWCAKRTAEDVTAMAEHFAEWLAGTEEPAFKVTDTPEANLGLATTGDLLAEVQARLNYIDDDGMLAGQCLTFRRSLPGHVLNYRTVHDHDDACNEETLRKVYAALHAAGVQEGAAMEAVNNMQNQAILFRERSLG